MPRTALGAKPVVLRCSRCGKFVDWEAARLQVACDCRTHLPLPMVLVRPATAADQDAVTQLFVRDFGRTRIVGIGDTHQLGELPSLVAEMKGEMAGALAYRMLPDAIQIMALATDPMWQRSGVGGQLVAEAELLARNAGRQRVLLATTNDNLPALYFYQRRGYSILEVVPGAMSRHVKDPAGIGFGGIPIRDEIRLEKRLEV